MKQIDDSGKSNNSKELSRFIQSIREQLLPLHLSSLVEPTGTQISTTPSN